ncbi:malonyl-CoA:anthocyanidin 5-O-glucoside-6''-O-malonyltransferase-like [Canna indica]|uniref:Malonyl-CoA:anthocyanidin 5-O-glucoside-6''-O-malonyltransferase-like n=1 Tax=Canna indica TaxID=4628 RepID=A0AAQ3KV48_9LILI|nr:malonyl-CoA:anthocyanidin 5-O-glucoside-6''-O-malonyltransferase-like [Canna indica]
MSAAAMVAVEEGGSSQRDLDGLIEELLATRLGSTKQESRNGGVGFHSVVVNMFYEFEKEYCDCYRKLTYAPASGDVFIDCSPAAIGPGVAFFEAESEGGDLGRLADDEVHDVDAFVQLIPELNATELPAPVFTVQVTRFRGAEGSADQGVALGFAAHHSVVDGRALWRFVEAWAVECRGEAGPPPPSLDRSVIKHPKGKEIARMFLHRMIPYFSTLPCASRVATSGRKATAYAPMETIACSSRANFLESAPEVDCELQ